jgi:hypothetical protein
LATGNLCPLCQNPEIINSVAKGKLLSLSIVLQILPPRIKFDSAFSGIQNAKDTEKAANPAWETKCEFSSSGMESRLYLHVSATLVYLLLLANTTLHTLSFSQD